MTVNGLSQAAANNTISGGQTWWWLVFTVDDIGTVHNLGQIGNGVSSGISSCRLYVDASGNFFLQSNGGFVAIGPVVVGEINTLSVVITHNVSFRVVLNDGAEQVFAANTFPLIIGLGNFNRGFEPACAATFYELAVFPNGDYTYNQHLKMRNGTRGSDIRNMSAYRNCFLHMRFETVRFNPATSLFTPLVIPAGATPISFYLRSGTTPVTSPVFVSRFGV